MQLEERVQRLEAASLAARRAGEQILGSLGHINDLRTKTSAYDLLTEVDEAAQRIILEHIARFFPNDAVLTEEAARAGGESLFWPDREKAVRLNAPVWVIDPLDGTTNFVQGLPVFCVSIALIQQGKPLLGIVYDPCRHELFTAMHGGGARLNGVPIFVSKTKTLGESLLATGLPYSPELGVRTNFKALTAALSKARNVRVLGSAALQLAYVACGRLNGFWELNLQAWDMAAGWLLVEEAGGRVTCVDESGFHLGQKSILATNGIIHHELAGVLKAGQSDWEAIRR